jgi:hypothetical protein
MLENAAVRGSKADMVQISGATYNETLQALRAGVGLYDALARLVEELKDTRVAAYLPNTLHEARKALTKAGAL